MDTLYTLSLFNCTSFKVLLDWLEIPTCFFFFKDFTSDGDTATVNTRLQVFYGLSFTPVCVLMS